jgi:hypothetical protein
MSREEKKCLRNALRCRTIFHDQVLPNFNVGNYNVLLAFIEFTGKILKIHRRS